MAVPERKSSGGDFKQIPPNKLYPAYIDQVILLGAQRSTYMGKDKIQSKVYIRFAFPTERIEFTKEGKDVDGPMVLGSQYTFSYYENAHLAKMLAGLRGKSMTDAEEDTFDIFSILGMDCQVLVTEYTNRDGESRSQIGNVLPAAEKLDHETPLVKFNPDDPKECNVTIDDLRPWIQEKIANRVHGETDQQRAKALHGKDQSALAEYESLEDEIPF